MKTNPFSRTNTTKKVNASMNVVPYIDVMLVLLVIFMVTAPMLTTGVDIDLPVAKTNTLATNEQLPIIVSLKADGEIFISYEGNTDVKMNENELIDTLQQLQMTPAYQLNGEPNMNVMINADKNNSYGEIMQLMAKLQQAGIQKVGLLTAPPAKSKN